MGPPARKNMNFFLMSGVKLQLSGYLGQGSMIADQKSLQMKVVNGSL